MHPLAAMALETSRIGDVQTVVRTEPIPSGWRALDGETLSVRAFPEYARALGIASPSFTLPNPTAPANHKFIVRMR